MSATSGTSYARSSLAGEAVEPRKLVRCPGCGGERYVSVRTAHRIRVGELSGLCPPCRRPRELTERERRLLARWWLDRYTDRELSDIALACGVLDACPENVAASRARYLAG